MNTAPDYMKPADAPGAIPARHTPRPALPVKPAWLTPAASEEWDRVAQMLVDDGLIARVDADVLALYAETVSTWMRAKWVVDQEGLTITNKRGTVRAHPAAKLAGQAADRLLRLASKLGMTPLGRARLTSKRKGSTNE